jgi:riboflavin biosynthesis pyrimidine reductase
VRCLLPSPVEDVSYDDLTALYAFPATGQRSGRVVRANFVSSTDGAAQGPDRRSGTLSSTADRQVFALQRSLCDVVLVGASTTRIEGYRPVLRSEVDQELRARHALTPVPTIAVVSQSLALDPELLAGGEAPSIVITSLSAPADARAAVEASVPVLVCGDEGVDLAVALDGRGHRRVLCEGGPTLFASLVASDCLDELCLTLSPQLIGGSQRRILNGPELVPPRRLELAHLLAAGDELFARYLVTTAG